MNRIRIHAKGCIRTLIISFTARSVAEKNVAKNTKIMRGCVGNAGIMSARYETCCEAPRLSLNAWPFSFVHLRFGSLCYQFESFLRFATRPVIVEGNAKGLNNLFERVSIWSLIIFFRYSSNIRW